LCVILKQIEAQVDMLEMERKLVEAREKLAKIRKARYTDKNTCKTNKHYLICYVEILNFANN
jgi:hypothetical protein